MTASKHATFSFCFRNTESRIITPVQLYSYPFNSMLSLSTNAMWDTGAVMSAITPETREKLKSKTINRIKISAIHTTQEVDVVLITIELPNRVIKQTVKAAVCNIASNAGMIIGMDIISLGDFALSNGNDQTLFSFAVPPYSQNSGKIAYIPYLGTTLLLFIIVIYIYYINNCRYFIRRWKQRTYFI